jgi:predicted transposase YdaD
VIYEVIQRLISTSDSIARELVTLLCLFAGLAFAKEEDQEWVKRRLNMANDFLRESPVYQHILQQGLEQGLERGIEQGLEQGIEQGVEQERKERILSLRQKILALVEAHFPEQKSVTSQLINLIKKPEILEDLFFQVAMAQSGEEVQKKVLQAIQRNAE